MATLRATAKHLGLAPSTLSRLVARGIITPEPGGGFDLARATAAYYANRRPKIDGKGQAPASRRTKDGGAMSYASARAARERVRLESERLELDARRGVLIARDEVARDAFNAAVRTGTVRTL